MDAQYDGAMPGRAATFSLTRKSTGGAGLISTNREHSDATDFDAADKATATVIAKLAFAGHVVHRGKSGDFTVSKWGMTYYAQDLESLEAFSRRLGVSK